MSTEAELFHKRLENQWRVGFTTPKRPADIDALFAGRTLEEALAKAIGNGVPAVISA